MPLHRLQADWRAARVYLANLKTLAPEAGVTETRRADAGVEYDLYEPAAPVATVILLQGLIIQAERDPRMVNFARALAGVGARVAVPHLPALSECQLDPADCAVIAALASALAGRHGGPIGLVAFSFGGGLGLAAAMDPACRGLLDPLLLFGAYHSLADLGGYFTAAFSRPPTTDQEWEDFIWTRMLVAYRDRARLGFTDAETTELTYILGACCSGPTIEQKKRFYESALRPREPLDPRLTASPEAAARLSAAGRLAGYPGRVLLLHAPDDIYIPPAHSRRILDELGGPSDSRRLLVTPLLSHVMPRFSWRWLDLFPLLSMTAELFRPGREA